MTDLSTPAQAVIDAYQLGPLEDGPSVAAVLRTVVENTKQYQGKDCFSKEVWTCDADEILAIATELENYND
jgi:hypothetical protein